MTRRAAIFATLTIMTLVAACGRREALMPEAGEAMPPKAAHATSAPTTDELMRPTVDARPERSDELLKKSEERKPDPFDLPPPGR